MLVRIAIDGPGGAGKSSTAKAVAKKLGIIYVDTGALYRTIGLYMTKNGINPKDSEEVIKNLDKFKLDLKFVDGRQVILLDGEDVGDSIRTPEISMAASTVSAIPEVRTYLLNMQRSIAEKNSVIMDGRDIGTVILPKAEVKIFLTASPESRAKRRYDELIARGQDVKYEDVYNEMVERDHNDSTREIAPCVPAKDATLLDNSGLSMDETVEKIVELVKKKRKTKKSFYMKAYAVLARPIRFFQRIKTTGLENVPKDDKGYIICSNHIGAKDVIMIGAVYHKQIRFIAKKELFKIPLLGSLIKALGAIKLDRGGNDVTAIKTAVSLAESGETVAIFPQGHRYPSVNPATTTPKNGAGLIAYRSGCDVIPVCIKVKNQKYRIFRKIDIIFGRPIKNENLGFTNGGTDEYRAASEKIFSEILSLGGYTLEEEKRSYNGDNT